jgi:transposase
MTIDSEIIKVIKMRFIQDLTLETTNMLKRIYQQSRHFEVRRRAHCILLSFEGFTTTKLMEIFKVERITIYNWFSAWEDARLVGLYSQPGRGRKFLFTPEQKAQIKVWAKENPKNLNAVISKAKNAWNITASKDTIKRILKSFSMTWHRVRKTVFGEPDPNEYKEKVKQLEELKKQAAAGEIDLRYCDESGFSLMSNSPYAWQEKDDPMAVQSQRSESFNVLGFMNTGRELDAYIFTGSINSDVVIACIDDFSKTRTRKTTIVLDQASIHRSGKIKDKLLEWEAKNITIFWLPTYSPQLNLIEILWRFMKYEWIELSAYESLPKLGEYIQKVLKNFGEEYIINFA